MDIKITWAVALLMASVLVIILAQFLASKSKTRKNWTWVGSGIGIAMILVVLVGTAIPSQLAFLNNYITGGTGTTYQFGNNSITYSVPGTNANAPSGGMNIITSNPIISIAGTDAQLSGTTVTTVSSQYQLNDNGFGAVTLGTTTAIPGQVLDLLLVNNTAYHNAVVQNLPVQVTSFPYGVKFNKNATITENIYTTTGVVVTGVAQNQTALGNGASYNLKDEMTANALTSTQDMTCIIELTAGVNATTTPVGAGYSMNGNPLTLKSTSTPMYYSVVGGNSRIWIYDVPALSTSATQTFTINLNSLSTGAFIAGSRMIKTCYTKEYFIDPNSGNIAYDVADSNGNVKSMAKYVATVYFQ